MKNTCKGRTDKNGTVVRVLERRMEDSNSTQISNVRKMLLCYQSLGTQQILHKCVYVCVCAGGREVYELTEDQV